MLRGASTMRRMISQTRFRSKPVCFNPFVISRSPSSIFPTQRRNPIKASFYFLALGVALLLTLLLVRPAAAQSDGGLAPEAQRIFELVNQARIDNGLAPLTLNPQLNLAAQQHVDDVIAHGNWGHYGSDGSTVAMRTARAGYGSSWVSENWVAASSPEQAMNWWMNDWIHRVNILTPRWDDVGIGAAPARGGFWIFVTDFGNIDGTAVAAATALAESAGAVAAPAIPPAAETLPAGGMDYSVRGGDTLLGIGLRYGIEWQDIALANDLAESDILSIGQVLHLPGRGGATATDAAAPPPVLEVSGQTHVIRPGETLSIIAARYGVAWQDVAAVNGLGERSLLQIGQELKLPASATAAAEAAPVVETVLAAEGAAAESAPVAETAPAEESAVGELTGRAGSAPAAKQAEADAAPAPTIVLTVPAVESAYTVRAGDTLSTIAARHDITWQALATANGLSEGSYLQIGQTLAIPGAAEPVRLRQTTDATGGPVTVLAAARAYTVRSGDTVVAIALRHGVDWQELLRVNGLREDSILQPGQILQLP
jgi:LysM repeat protein/uncharacterized protein YkwD